MSSLSSDPAVTIVVSRRVKPGCEAEFEAFLAGITAACQQFPGYLGSHTFRPVSPEDPEYRVLFKFDRLSHLRDWEVSPERQAWFAIAEPLIQHPPEIQVLTGLETWFTQPGQAALVPPPRHKMALVTWLAVFPLITAISASLQQILAPLPLLVRVMIVTAIAVPTMTYLLMPQMTRLFAGWLYPPPAPLEPQSSPIAALEPDSTPALPELQTLTPLEIDLPQAQVSDLPVVIDRKMSLKDPLI